MKRIEKRSCWKFEREMYCQTRKKTTKTNTKTKTNTNAKAKAKFVGSEKEMYYQRRSSYCSVSFPDQRALVKESEMLGQPIIPFGCPSFVIVDHSVTVESVKKETFEKRCLETFRKRDGSEVQIEIFSKL